MGPVGNIAPGDLGAAVGRCWGSPTRFASMDGGTLPALGGRASAAGGVAPVGESSKSEVRLANYSAGCRSRAEQGPSAGCWVGMARRPGSAYSARGSLLYVEEDLAGNGGYTFDTARLRRGSGGQPTSWMAKYS